MYKEEIKNLMYSFLKEDWISDEELDETIELAITIMGGWDKVTNDLIIGISNGYSIQQQLDILKFTLDNARAYDRKRI